MRIKLVLGSNHRMMSTDNGIPRIGDVVEFTPNEFTTVATVEWVLLEPEYKEGYITHQAVVTLHDHMVRTR